MTTAISALERAGSRHGLHIVSPHEIRPLLRRFRIRAIGMLDRAGARHLHDEQPAKYCLLATVDAYSEGIPPLFGLSLRLLRLSDLRVVWAGAHIADGEQFRGWLGHGEVTSLDTLANRVTQHLIANMIGDLHSINMSTPSPELAIIPFDDLGNDAHAARILTGYLTAALVASKVPVLEPDIVQEMCGLAGRWTRGEVTYALLDLLRDSLGINFVITGTVDTYHAEGVGQTASLSVGVRLLDTRTRQILAATEISKSARGGTGVLHTGQPYVGETVMKQAAAAMLKQLHITSRSFLATKETDK
ncbi:MAG: hypothetical protein D6800_05730 [Candidatus Zixiibacteriota bacterium]|nr:MAG: hypothetical protein D6800_05730 [candidate division Zixibacteria bacterium]